MTLPFSTSSPGIGGQIKRRYADFQVEEIAFDGTRCSIQRYHSDPLPEFELLVIPPKPENKDQLHLDLEKINSDQQWIIKQTARFLRGSKNRFGYAGLKDKRAITCQRISLFDPDIERLTAFRGRGFCFRRPEWSTKRIEIGDLLANFFNITIRDIDLSADEIRRRFDLFANEVPAKGIANYFGEQRFGGSRNVTHLVGKKIIENDFENAVLLYLCHLSENEDPATHQTRAALALDRDYKKALISFNPKYRFERAMLSHLGQFPRDFAGAICTLPKGMRFLFTHAYQSHLFNKMLARRLIENGDLKAVPGDQVDENGDPMLHLIGHETVLDDSPAGKLSKTILDEEKIVPSMFRINRGVPEATSKGGWKAMALYPKKLLFHRVEDDAFYPNKHALVISFELPKGSYATTVLDELMKNESHFGANPDFSENGTRIDS